jgi:hypothetical protein
MTILTVDDDRFRPVDCQSDGETGSGQNQSEKISHIAVVVDN